jgi:hypothetical protein
LKLFLSEYSSTIGPCSKSQSAINKNYIAWTIILRSASFSKPVQETYLCQQFRILCQELWFIYVYMLPPMEWHLKNKPNKKTHNLLLQDPSLAIYLKAVLALRPLPFKLTFEKQLELAAVWQSKGISQIFKDEFDSRTLKLILCTKYLQIRF